jgi:hypothetical protein
MTFKPNLGGTERVLYGLAGVAMMAVGFLTVLGPWLRIALPVLGAIALIEGLIGF